jgi:hypothetical protein
MGCGRVLESATWARAECTTSRTTPFSQAQQDQGAILLPTLESLLCLSNPQFESEIGSVHEPRQAAFRLDVRDSPRNEYRRDSSFSNPFELSDSAKPFPAFHMLS